MLGRLEEAVFPAFQLVLTEDVQEFHPYVFQIFAQLIELRPPPVAPVYMQLLPGLLSPTFWERSGNIPALIRLVQVRGIEGKPVRWIFAEYDVAWKQHRSYFLRCCSMCRV